MKQLNTGKLNLYYLGDGPGDKNFPDIVLRKEATLYRNEEGELILSFTLNDQEFLMRDLVHFNLHSFYSQYEDLSLYYLNTIAINDDYFMMIANYAWTKLLDLENFELVAHFKGRVPEELSGKWCPAL